MSPRIEVVGAVIVRGGSVLCARRGPDRHMAGRWEFPGGKIEPGESGEEALVREIQEELACRITVGDRITRTTHGDIALTTYACTLVGGEPVATEHAELRWVAPGGLAELDWAPADLPTVALVATDAGTRIDRFDHEGAILVAEEIGGSGPVFLLIHGIGMGRSVFQDLITHLRPHGTIIAIDQPGYGEAPEPPRTPTMERTADIVAGYLRARGIGPVVVIGHSMGTQVAVELAARHSDLVARVVLAAPGVNAAERTAVRQLLRLAQDLAVESPRVLLAGAREYLRAGPHLRRKMRAMLVHRPEDTYPRVHVPTLVLRGETDRVVPEPWVARVMALLPDAHLVEIPDHGHETLIRDATPAARAILACL